MMKARSRCLELLGAGVVVLFAACLPVQAALSINVGSTTIAPDGSGTVDVTITSTTGADLLDLFGAEFAISTGGTSSLLFLADPTDPQLSNTRYLFYGNSVSASQGEAGYVASPYTTYIGGDGTLTGAGVTVPLASASPSTDKLLVTLDIMANPGNLPQHGDTFTISLVQPSLNTFFWNPSQADIAFTTTAGTVTVLNPAPVDVTWTGAGGTTWSTASGTNNWKKTSDGAAANYTNGSLATFDDSAAGSLTADISAANVSPSSVVFNNSAKDYTVTGTMGIVGAATVLKQGSGKTTIGSVNSYTGATTVENGVLQLNGFGAYDPVLNLGGTDIQGGTLIIDYSGQSDPRATVQSLLAASYHSGSATHFDIGQFRSSTADSDHGLGWKSTLNYQLHVAYALYGDATLDGNVDISDLSLLGQNWNGSDKNWAQGDFNYDGKVDISDLSALGQHWNQNMAGAAGASIVPEPGTFALLIAGALGLVAFAWRRHK